WKSEHVRGARTQRSTRVTADADPWELQRLLDVLLGHHVVDRHDAAISGRDDVPRRIRRVLARLARDLRDRLPLETRILGIACIHEHDAVPAARGLDRKSTRLNSSH